jgi:hypothetical protein
VSVGTIVLTAANSTLGLAFVTNALRDFPNHHAVLNFLNNGPSDPNTAKLRGIV